jgi:nitrous oxide reductase accessory protein NosL
MRPSTRLLALILVLAAGCRRGLAPQPILLDQASCARCGMLISSTHDAAEVVFEDQDPLFYDDVGCLASDRILSRGRFEVWVRVDGGSAWKKAGDAFFARPAEARTPMGYGLAAFSSADAARAKDREGRVRTWGDVERELTSRAEQTASGASK